MMPLQCHLQKQFISELNLEPSIWRQIEDVALTNELCEENESLNLKRYSYNLSSCRRGVSLLAWLAHTYEGKHSKKLSVCIYMCEGGVRGVRTGGSHMSTAMAF